MSLQLVAFEDQPGRVAVTKIGTTVPDGRFFLDFTRKLDVIRWLGVRNRFVGPAVALLVPVVHEAQASGGYVIGIDQSQPYFRDVRRLWKAHYPSKPQSISLGMEELKVIADFAAQFPEDA